MPRAPSNRSRRTAAPTAREPEGQEIGDQRRRHLIEAAYELVGEKGLEGLRTRDIAARAGVNISTLHYYFGTKEQLLIALIEHVSRKFDPSGGPEEGAGAPSGNSGAGEPPGLAEVLEATWQTFRANPHLAVVLQELTTRSHRDASAQSTFRAVFTSWNQGVADYVREGVAAGRLRSDLDPEAAATIISSFTIGAMVQLGVNASAFDLSTVSGELARWVAAAVPPGSQPAAVATKANARRSSRR